MAYNGCTVIDMDAHIRERADRFFKDYLTPNTARRSTGCAAIQESKGERYALFGSRTAVIEQIEAGRALGVRDTFGLTARSEMAHGRIAFPPGRKEPLPPIRPEVNWDAKARLEDMGRAHVVAGDHISTERPSNRMDIAYLFYLPFSQVFISGDRLHRRCAPLFLRANQEFVWGPDLKEDLRRMNAHYLTLPETVRDQGIMNFAGAPPTTVSSQPAFMTGSVTTGGARRET
jgi:hypothetical protein